MKRVLPASQISRGYNVLHTTPPEKYRVLANKCQAVCRFLDTLAHKVKFDDNTDHPAVDCKSEPMIVELKISADLHDNRQRLLYLDEPIG
jgi:hypothetical protein